MLIKVDYICKLCNKSKGFYIMPCKKPKNNSFVYSELEYKVVCKKCKKTYLLTIALKAE